MWWDSDSLGGRKASARTSTFLRALAPLGAGSQVCNKQVSIKEPFIILWTIMHFSHEKCGYIILCCAASARSDEVWSQIGRGIQGEGKDIFIWIRRKRSAAIFKSCCTIGNSLLFPICGMVY